MEFTWYEKFTRMVEGVPDDSQRARLVDAVLGYGTYGREPEGLEWPLDTLFEGFRSDIDNSHAYRKGGKAGGRASGKTRAGMASNPPSNPPSKPSETASNPPSSPKKERKNSKKERNGVTNPDRPGVAMSGKPGIVSRLDSDDETPTTFLVEVDEDVPLRASGRWAL